ncbi:MAG TPA: ABC transporter permease [Gaiellaceae bacterium]|nr:ABC transporter permease [Gaiellaceae bacterium]
MSAVRVALVGGLISFRGLFGWLHPAIFVPTLIVPPIFQVLFFAYLGRAAELESDTFYVVGNSIQLAALPGLFAISHAINGERRSQTLASLLASPASRVALFLGRSLPVMAIGLGVSVVSFAFGTLLLDVEIGARALPAIALAMIATAFSCTALGIAHAAVGLRVREMAVFSNLVFAVLLVFCGVNVPLDDLPGWMSTAAQGLPVTHAVEAGRDAVAGGSLGSVAGLLVTEIAIGAAYLVLGLALLRYYERVAKRRATIDLV